MLRLWGFPQQTGRQREGERRARCALRVNCLTEYSGPDSACLIQTQCQLQMPANLNAKKAILIIGGTQAGPELVF